MRLLIVATLICSSAMASEANKNNVSKCEKMGLIVHSIMIDRMAENTVSSTIEKFGDGFKGIVLDAYSYQKFSSEGYKKRIAMSFRNKYELECYKSGY